MSPRTTIKIMTFLALIGTSYNASAELGDYGFWQTLKNLIWPMNADNPVTHEQQTAQHYPLLSNPNNFNDGFSGGDYLQWQTVQLHPSTGAICGNGSPYKFFVNRVADTSNTIVYMEGGGACWDYASCSGQSGIRGARNPNGVPDDYMSLLNPGASLVSPFVVRLHPWTRTKTQGWNMVYVPYCTGDIYSGDRVAVYDDPRGENDPLVWHHNGTKNLRAVVAWLKNNLQRPAQMLATGCSAGGAGSLANYYPLRRDMEPTKSYLINDSGPIYPAVVGGSTDTYPSLKLQNHIRNVWGLDSNGVGPLNYLNNEMPSFNLNNLGTLSGALAQTFPNDRLGQVHFWEDLNYSSYSYERFYDDIVNEPNQNERERKIHEKWYQDTNNLIGNLANFDNFGYFFPRFRDVNESHCATIIDFNHGDIQEMGLELKDFIKDVMEGSGSVMQASEEDRVSDFNKPFNLIYWLIEQLL